MVAQDNRDAILGRHVWFPHHCDLNTFTRLETPNRGDKIGLVSDCDFVHPYDHITSPYSGLTCWSGGNSYACALYAIFGIILGINTEKWMFVFRCEYI